MADQYLAVRLGTAAVSGSTDNSGALCTAAKLRPELLNLDRSKGVGHGAGAAYADDIADLCGRIIDMH